MYQNVITEANKQLRTELGTIASQQFEPFGEEMANLVDISNDRSVVCTFDSSLVEVLVRANSIADVVRLIAAVGRQAHQDGQTQGRTGLQRQIRGALGI